MGFYRYKPEQGKYARVATAVFLGVSLLFGCVELYRSEFCYPDENTAVIVRLPVLGVDLTGGLIAVCVVFVLGLMAIGIITLGYRGMGGRPSALQRRSEAIIDFLIDVESELRKVTWPAREDLRKSTLVVIVTVLIFGAMLFGMDKMVEKLMRLIRVY